MERYTIRGLINSISRFVHLVACQATKTTYLKDFRQIMGILKLLKPVLDDAAHSRMSFDEQLLQVMEELDMSVNEAREFMEKQPQRMSKIYSVLQSELIMLKVRKSTMEICHLLSKLMQSSCFSTQSTSILQCMQEIQCAEQDLTSELIENALKDLRENIIPSLDDIIKVMDTLGLASNWDLLMESIALEKERIKAELKEKTEDVDCINQIIALVNHIGYCMAKLEQFGYINGQPIPSHFCCPLSLQLMADPVIVASGQTYERPFIQKWLDSGLRICPRTRQTLPHTNLTSNFTVKALIANWCEDNNIKLCNSFRLDQTSNPFLSNEMLKEFRPRNGFHGSLHNDRVSRCSVEHVTQMEQQITEVSSGCEAGDSCPVSNQKMIPEKVTLQGKVPHEQQSCCQSESNSSVISSIDISSKLDEKVSLLGEPFPSSSPLMNNLELSQWLSTVQLCGSKNGQDDSIRNHSRFSSSGSDDLTSSSHVHELIEDLKSQVPEVQTAAASELRLLAKNNMENRVLVAKCGAIPHLVSLLQSNEKKVQENAVTALLNLSISDNNKILIAEAGAIDPLIYVLEQGSTEAKENSAAALFSLSTLQDYKVKIGRSGAIKSLVNLLGSGSIRGKKDAATALFNLSIFHENKARIVQAGAVRYLVELMDPSTGMVDKSVALLANLSTIPEGRLAIAQEGGIPLLVEIVEAGSQRGKENAASALLQLCLNGQKFCSLVLQEGAVPPLIALSQFGTPRAKEKAQQILSHFRSQREGTARKAKS